MIRRPPGFTLFPYTTLFRARRARHGRRRAFSPAAASDRERRWPLRRERIHIGPEQHAASCILLETHHAGLSDARRDLVVQAAQAVGDQVRGARLLEPELGMLVDVATCSDKAGAIHRRKGCVHTPTSARWHVGTLFVGITFVGVPTCSRAVV